MAPSRLPPPPAVFTPPRPCDRCKKPVSALQARALDGPQVWHLGCYRELAVALYLTAEAARQKAALEEREARRAQEAKAGVDALSRCPRCGKRMVDGSSRLTTGERETWAVVEQSPGSNVCRPCVTEEVRLRNATRNAPGVIPPGAPLASAAPAPQSAPSAAPAVYHRPIELD